MRKITIKLTENGYNIKYDTNPLVTINYLNETLINYSIYNGKSLEEISESFNREINRIKGTKKKKEDISKA